MYDIPLDNEDNVHKDESVQENLLKYQDLAYKNGGVDTSIQANGGGEISPVGGVL